MLRVQQQQQIHNFRLEMEQKQVGFCQAPFLRGLNCCGSVQTCSQLWVSAQCRDEKLETRRSKCEENFNPVLPSNQGKPARWTSTSARATPATTAGPASTNPTASPAIACRGGWGPAARSVSPRPPEQLPAYFPRGCLRYCSQISHEAEKGFCYIGRQSKNNQV